MILCVSFRSRSTLLIYLPGSLMLPTLPHCCPFCLASSFAFVLYVFLVWLTSPLHCTCLLCIQNELVGVGYLSAQCVRQAAGWNGLLSLSALSKFKGAFSCLTLQELAKLTSLIYPKFFLLLFSPSSTQKQIRKNNGLFLLPEQPGDWKDAFLCNSVLLSFPLSCCPKGFYNCFLLICVQFVLR